MNRFRIIAPLVFLPLLAGCAQFAGVPGAEPFPATTLQRIKSAHHWDIIASDVAAQTTSLKTHPALQGKPLYVVASDDGDFARGFRTMLITRLVNSGLPVATRPEGATPIKYETQVVRHPRQKTEYPGKLSALAGGILVARQILETDASAVAIANSSAALLAGADLLAAYTRLRSPTNTEVIITTTLVDGDRFLMRKTDTYYVEDAEARMFEASPRAPAKVIGVVGQ